MVVVANNYSTVAFRAFYIAGWYSDSTVYLSTFLIHRLSTSCLHLVPKSKLDFAGKHYGCGTRANQKSRKEKTVPNAPTSFRVLIHRYCSQVLGFSQPTFFHDFDSSRCCLALSQPDSFFQFLDFPCCKFSFNFNNISLRACVPRMR